MDYYCYYKSVFAYALGDNMEIRSDKVRIKLLINNKDVELFLDEARKLYDQLDKVFCNTRSYTSTGILPFLVTSTYPSPTYNPDIVCTSSNIGLKQIETYKHTINFKEERIA